MARRRAGRRPSRPFAERYAADEGWSLETLSVHAGQEPDELTGAVAPPIYQTSTYAQDGIGRPRDGWEYARTGNPTRRRLERAVAALEGGEQGIAFSSGAAATAMLAELALPGDEVVIGDDVYGGTYRLFERVLRPKGIIARYVDLASDPANVRSALSPRTRLVWFETPTNPLLKLVDIAGVADAIAGHQRCRRRAPAASSSTTRSPRRPSSDRSITAPTSSSTRRRSTSAATPTRSTGSS